MMNNLIPRSGDIVRPLLMGQQKKISKSTCFATIFIERVFDFMFLLLILCVLFLTIKSGFKSPETSMIDYIKESGILLLIILTAIIGFLFFLVFQRDKSLKIIRFLCKPFPAKFSMRLEEIINRFGAGLEVIKDFKKVVIISAISLLILELFAFQTLITIYAFRSNMINTLSIFQQVWMCNFVLIIGALSLIIPSPAGLGSFHLAFAKTLEMFGEIPFIAKSIAIVLHSVSLFPVMIVGLYFLYREKYVIRISRK
ncbi:MAG: hypothetical protein A2161_01280 [Candidatus Schekmanbacteria bacterium RBG_13_48_7]|uniref:Flippase-like domain-containing protein n=1 Tax=Candidatus Schekmanbacteria bacterium RBG_13_48_7 TaxID=1817878 RepID=A0A1F7S957_9BACT|nr:MAG: hypothetical protein A2161_01280 [Candidatus Schekmanbacteria bacterium RBG_13_48_7]